MKQSGFLYPTLFMLITFICNGCLSVPNSPVPKFYTLHLTVSQDKVEKKDITPQVIIGIGPVEIPEYQNRPQIVTRDKDEMLTFAQFDRWGEALDSGLARLILERLAMVFPQAELQMFPCNFSIPLDYQIIINVTQLESQLDKDLFLMTQWTIIDSKTKKMLLTKRSEIHQAITPRNYFGLAQALSKAVTLLSDEIAENLSLQSKAKGILAQ